MSQHCATQSESRDPLAVPGLATAETQALLQGAQSGVVAGPAYTRAWQNRHVALIAKDEADPSSTVFAQAARSLGAHVTNLKPADLGLRRSARADLALVLLGRLYSAIGCAGLSRSTVDSLQRSAGVLVLSDLASAIHPSRLLADVMTLKQFSSAGAVGVVDAMGAMGAMGTLARTRLGIYGSPRSGLLRAWRALADAAQVEVVDLSKTDAQALASSCTFLCRPSAPPELLVTEKSSRNATVETSLSSQQRYNHLLVVQALLRSGVGTQP